MKTMVDIATKDALTCPGAPGELRLMNCVYLRRSSELERRIFWMAARRDAYAPGTDRCVTQIQNAT
jgi:hypothetical protein